MISAEHTKKCSRHDELFRVRKLLLNIADVVDARKERIEDLRIKMFCLSLAGYENFVSTTDPSHRADR